MPSRHASASGQVTGTHGGPGDRCWTRDGLRGARWAGATSRCGGTDAMGCGLGSWDAVRNNARVERRPS